MGLNLIHVSKGVSKPMWNIVMAVTRYTCSTICDSLCYKPDIVRKQIAWWILITCRLLFYIPWWRHHMETLTALLAICAGNSSVTGEFPAQRPVTRNFDVFFDQRLNKCLSKQWWGWWFETPSRPLWRHSDVRCKYWGHHSLFHSVLSLSNGYNRFHTGHFFIRFFAY